MQGLIYFLTNPSIPGLVKIGHTTQDIEARIRQLNSTGVPTPFELAACFAVKNSALAEQLVHSSLAKVRHSDQREFFIGSVSTLLTDALPALINAIDQTVADHPRTQDRKTHDIEPEEINLLLFLTGDQRQYGYSEYAVHRHSEEPELKTEARLARLKGLKLVTEKRSRKDWESPVWRITSEGKKFLYDYGYFTQEMLS
jgi:T5orf172 domain